MNFSSHLLTTKVTAVLCIAGGKENLEDVPTNKANRKEKTKHKQSKRQSDYRHLTCWKRMPMLKQQYLVKILWLPRVTVTLKPDGRDLFLHWSYDFWLQSTRAQNCLSTSLLLLNNIKTFRCFHSTISIPNENTTFLE